MICYCFHYFSPFVASVWHCRGRHFRGFFQEYVPGMYSLEYFHLKNNAAKKQSHTDRIFFLCDSAYDSSHRYNTRRACTCFHSRYKRYLSSSLFVWNTKRFIVSTSKVFLRIALFWCSVNGKKCSVPVWIGINGFPTVWRSKRKGRQEG